MIALIDYHRAAYGLEPICRVLSIDPSTYHRQATRRRDPDRPPAWARRDALLRVKKWRVFDEHFQV